MKECRFCLAEFEDYEHVEFIRHENNCVPICKCCKTHFPGISDENFTKHKEQCEKEFMATITKEEVQKEQKEEEEKSYGDEGDINSGVAWQCGKCDKIVFKNKMKAHYTKYHNTWICNICKKDIIKSEMKQHLIVCREQNNKKKIQCDICDKWMMPSYIYAHTQKEHKIKYKKKQKDETTPKKGNRIVCYICKKSFNSKYIYKHMQTIHKEVYVAPDNLKNKPGPKGKKKKAKQCTVCGEKRINMSQHMKDMHGISMGHKGREVKGNLFFCTFQMPIKRFVLNMMSRPSILHKGYHVRVHFRKTTYYSLVHHSTNLNPRIRRSDGFIYTNRTGKFTKTVHYNQTFKKHYPHHPKYLKPIKKCLIKEGVVGNEWGLLEEHGHCHMYFKYFKKVLIRDMNRFIRRRCRFLGDIEPGRQAQRQIKYCSKEDLHAIPFNLDKERLHENWQMAQVAFKATDFREGVRTWSYQQTKWQTDFKFKKFKRVFDSIVSAKAMEDAAANAKNYVNKGILKKLSPSKKGIWLHGSPGIGKTSTLFDYTKGKHFHMPKDLNRFCFNSWDKPNSIIVFEDVSKAEIAKHSRMINELTDDRGFTVAERKGGEHFIVKPKKVIIISNDPPPTDAEWGQGFERRFDVINGDDLEGTMYQYLE